MQAEAQIQAVDQLLKLKSTLIMAAAEANILVPVLISVKSQWKQLVDGFVRYSDGKIQSISSAHVPFVPLQDASLSGILAFLRESHLTDGSQLQVAERFTFNYPNADS